MSPLFAFFEGAFSPGHIVVVLIVGLLLFGKRLPEMGRFLGKGIVEFKKGLHGVEDELEGVKETAQSPVASDLPRPPQRIPTSAPQFETKVG
jgi:sec-independent protein translocase protein TatA